MERLIIVDPYNEQQMRMLKEFDNGNIYDQLNTLRVSISKDDYLALEKEKNEIDSYLFLEKEGKIIDKCQIHIEKDIKLGRINLSVTSSKNVKKMLSLINATAFHTLKIEELFVEVGLGDNRLTSFLLSESYENLGVLDDKMIFLKEKEEVNEVQRMRV